MMLDPVRLAAFALASVTLITIPGPNLVYILTRSVSQGTRAGLVSAAGVETGTLVHVTAAALGLSSLVAASPVGFAVLRYAGAGYLAYLGVRTLVRSPGLDLAGEAARRPLRRVYRDGAVVNLLNPKVALFFLAFLPQFVSPQTAPRPQMMVLGAVFFVLALVLDTAYALAGGAVGGWSRRPRGHSSWQRYAVGGTYLSLGAYAALSGR
jgi:threonine/homoserine/homoserine lactone efflux protein